LVRAGYGAKIKKTNALAANAVKTSEIAKSQGIAASLG
jgi:hypothetical protein